MKTMKEIWKDIKGYEGLYQVSNTGKVKSLDRRDVKGRLRKGVVLKQSMSGDYLSVALQFGDFKRCVVHRLVAKEFVPNPHKKRNVHHKDHNKFNNKANNLEWVTQKENIEKAILSNHFNNKSILQVNPTDGVIVNKFASISKAVESHPEFHLGGIASCLSGKYRKSGGYIWVYDESEIKSAMERYRRPHRRSVAVSKICRYTNTVIDIYVSMSSAATSEDGIRAGAISLCCKGIRKTHAGYKWRYINK